MQTVCLKSFLTYCKVCLSNSFILKMLGVQMVQLYVEGCRVKLQIEDNVQTVDDAHTMSLEFNTVNVVTLNSGKKSLGRGGTLKQTVKKQDTMRRKYCQAG